MYRVALGLFQSFTTEINKPVDVLAVAARSLGDISSQRGINYHGRHITSDTRIMRWEYITCTRRLTVRCFRHPTASVRRLPGGLRRRKFCGQTYIDRYIRTELLRITAV